MDPQQVLAELRTALSNSNDNLADCADMDIDAMAEVQRDNEALQWLVDNDATGTPRILAYL